MFWKCYIRKYNSLTYGLKRIQKLNDLESGVICSNSTTKQADSDSETSVINAIKFIVSAVTNWLLGSFFIRHDLCLNIPDMFRQTRSGQQGAESPVNVFTSIVFMHVMHNHLMRTLTQTKRIRRNMSGMFKQKLCLIKEPRSHLCGYICKVPSFIVGVLFQK